MSENIHTPSDIHHQVRHIVSRVCYVKVHSCDNRWHIVLSAEPGQSYATQV